MKFIVTGGGTGGHIYPAVAIAKGLKERFNAEVVYIGGTRGLERDIIPKEGIPFRSIDLAGFKRSLSPGNIMVLWKAVRGIKEASRLIKEIGPAAVIGTGGYVCGPVVMAAALARVPTMIHEQNAYPGITNRMLSRFVRCVFLTFEEAKSFFPSGADFRLTGLPVRREILSCNREGARERLDMPEKDVLVLSFGGSQGAKSINDAILSVLERFAGKQGVYFLHVTGPGNYEEFMNQFDSMNLADIGNITITSYMHDMPAAYAAADLVISRAGAATLAEITARGLPSILIPYPYASGDHQRHNALALQKAKAAIVINNKDLSGELLYLKLEKLLGGKGLLADMAKASKNMGKPDALEDILDCIGNVLDNSK